MLPIGVLAFGVSFSGPLSARISPKFLILGGQALVLVATVLLAFADAPHKYWPFAFPAFCLGTMGAMLAYTTPAAEAGTVGALFNGALQLGSAVGIAAVTSIEASVEARAADGFLRFDGRRAVFWFVLAVVVLETLAVAVFYRTDRAAPDTEAEEPALSAESTSEKTSGIEEDRLSARAEVV
jgi:nitrate/nitrite transporter NarK